MIRKGLFIFYTFWYLLPGLFTLIYPEFITELFKGKVYFISLIYSLTFLIVTLFFLKLNFKIPVIKQFKYLGFIFNSKSEWFFIILFFISSIYFYYVFGLSFRQTGDSISEGGALLYLNYITKAYIKCFLFKEIILLSNKNYNAPYLKFLLIFIGSLLSTSAALDALLPLMIMVFVFQRNLIYSQQELSFSFYLIILLIIIAVPFIGTANKYGIEESYYIFINNSEFFVKNLFRRIATWHHSINIYIEIVYNEVIPNSFDLISNIFKTSFNRFSIIFGGERYISEVHTAARFNYLQLFLDTSNPKTGATSGIIATSLLFFPFGIFIFPLLLSLYYKFIYSLMPTKPSNLTHFFILMIVVLPVISSPLDLIILISPEFFFIFFLICVKYYILNLKNEKK